MSGTISEKLQEGQQLQTVTVGRQSLEEDLFTLQSVAPEKVSELPNVFRESLLCAVNDILDKRNAGILLALLRGTDLGDQAAVFASLDRMSYRRSGFLKKAISSEFRSRVHAMAKRAVAGLA